MAQSSLLTQGITTGFSLLFDLYTLLFNFVCTWRIQWGVELAVVGRNTEHVVYGAVLTLLEVVQGQGRGMMEGGQRGPGGQGSIFPQNSRKRG